MKEGWKNNGRILIVMVYKKKRKNRKEKLYEDKEGPCFAFNKMFTMQF